MLDLRKAVQEAIDEALEVLEKVGDSAGAQLGWLHRHAGNAGSATRLAAYGAVKRGFAQKTPGSTQHKWDADGISQMVQAIRERAPGTMEHHYNKLSGEAKAAVRRLLN